MVNIPYDKKKKKYCSKCGCWTVPKPDMLRCSECNYKIRLKPHSTNNGPTSSKRMRVDHLVKRY